MYRAPALSLLILLLGVSFVSASFAAPANRAKARTAKKPKVRRACNTLRHAARTQPTLRARAQSALLKKRESEKTCRQAFARLLPGVKPKPVGGSMCRGLAVHSKGAPRITEALKKARRQDRQADMYCARVLKRLKRPPPNPKASGGR